MKTKHLFSTVKQLFSMVGSFAILFLLTGCIFDSLKTPEDTTGNGDTIVVEVTVRMPHDTPQTRISFEQDGLNVDLAWEEGDNIDLLVVHGGDKTAHLQVPVTIDGGNNKKATFTLSLPLGTYETFDLYGVYGGGGLDATDPHLIKLPTYEESTSSCLKELGKNKGMVLVFSETGINKNSPNLSLDFEHIGSLFNIQVKNIGGSTLDKVTEARLTASTAIPAYSNSGAETYDVITGTFSGSQTTSLTFRPVSSSNVVSEGILEFWAWVPIELGGGTEVLWPELGLEIDSDGASITATTTKGTKNATVGKAYYLYATYDGADLIFATESDMTVATGKVADFRDGNLYNTVTIGSQTWLKENLAYLPSVVGPGTGSYTYPYYYVHGYDGTDVATAKETTNYQTYGVLYNWPAAMNGEASSDVNPSGVRGICPYGWHLPSDDEWEQLVTHLGGSDIAGDKLKEKGTTHWESPNEGTNSSGFTALPGGYRYSNGTFYHIGYYGYWWSSAENYTDYAWNWTLYYDYGNVSRNYNYKSYGFSVRCVRD